MTTTATGRLAWVMVVLRLLLGSTFTLHGSQKVFGTFGGHGLIAFGEFVHKDMGIPVALGYLAALCELVGGCLVLLGVVAEFGALLIVPVMLVAIFRVHWAGGYFTQNHGFEYALNLLLVAIALIIGGPGKLALWDPLGKFRKD